jgi:hypothetical protein
MRYVILVQSLVNDIYTGSTLFINFPVCSCILSIVRQAMHSSTDEVEYLVNVSLT